MTCELFDRSLVMMLVMSATTAFAGPIDHLADINLTDHLRGGGVPRDGIPAVTNPSFVPASEAQLGELDPVLGVFMEGVAKAYPEAIGWRHEIINDQIGERFISVTLCPLTGTPQVFDATDEDGSQIEFGVSGLLINSNLVMYDRRDDNTLYPQMIYTAINGDHEGQRLTLLPVVHTTFGRWKQLHPDTQVAELATGLERYSANLQEAYARSGVYQPLWKLPYPKRLSHLSLDDGGTRSKLVWYERSGPRCLHGRRIACLPLRHDGTESPGCHQ